MIIANDINYKVAVEKSNVNYATVYKCTWGYLNKSFEVLKHEKWGPKSKTQIDPNSMTEIEILKLELECLALIEYRNLA